MDQGNLEILFFYWKKRMENNHFYRNFSTLPNLFWDKLNKLIKLITTNLSLKL